MPMPPLPIGIGERRRTRRHRRWGPRRGGRSRRPRLHGVAASRASSGPSRLVAEVPYPGEHDGHASGLGRGQDLVVALRAAGVDHRGAARRRRRPRARRGTGRTRRRRAPRRRARSPALRTAIQDASTRDIWPAPIPTVAPSLHQDDRVRLHAPRDRPGELEVAPTPAAVGSRRETDLPVAARLRARRRGPAPAPRRAACGRPSPPAATRRADDPQVRPGGERRRAHRRRTPGAITTSVKTSRIASAAATVARAVEGDDPAERAHRVARERGLGTRRRRSPARRRRTGCCASRSRTRPRAARRPGRPPPTRRASC